jgi:hypothetical protein
MIERQIERPHAHAVGFGGEEGVEQLVRILGEDSDAVVRHTDQDFIREKAGAERGAARFDTKTKGDLALPPQPTNLCSSIVSIDADATPLQRQPQGRILLAPSPVSPAAWRCWRRYVEPRPW